MNLYRIYIEDYDYDMYDSAIVAASSIEEARNINPRNGRKINWAGKKFHNTWVRSPDKVGVEYIGQADEKFSKPGVVLASFNAG